MKNIKIAFYIFIGGFSLLLIQSLLLTPSYANDDIIIESEKSKINSSINFEKAAEISVKSVVHIKSKYLKDEIYRYYDPFYGNRYFNNPKEKVASGSGVIISEDGFIITNMHVINEAEEVEVVLNDKRTFNAKIIGLDPNSDLALLKIESLMIQLKQRFFILKGNMIL